MMANWSHCQHSISLVKEMIDRPKWESLIVRHRSALTYPHIYNIKQTISKALAIYCWRIKAVTAANEMYLLIKLSDNDCISEELTAILPTLTY